MKEQEFPSIWDLIEDNPAIANDFKQRSALMMALQSHITHAKLSPADAAKLFGVKPSTIANLIRGNINIFTVDTLVNMLKMGGVKL